INYHDSNKKFPLGAVAHPKDYFAPTATATFRDASTNPPGVWGTTWAISILPQIEQQALFNLWNPNVGYDPPTQRQVTGTPIQIYKCPSYSTAGPAVDDRKSTRLNSSHVAISYAVFCLKKKNISSYST